MYREQAANAANTYNASHNDMSNSSSAGSIENADLYSALANTAGISATQNGDVSLLGNGYNCTGTDCLLSREQQQQQQQQQMCLWDTSPKSVLNYAAEQSCDYYPASYNPTEVTTCLQFSFATCLGQLPCFLATQAYSLTFPSVFTWAPVT